MNFPTDRTAHTTAFDGPVVYHCKCTRQAASIEWPKPLQASALPFELCPATHKTRSHEQWIRSFQDRYRLVHTGFIVLHHWKIHTTSTMLQYPTQLHYPATERTSLCPILSMQSARLWSDKYKYFTSLVWLNRELNSRSPACEVALYQFGHHAR